MMCHTAVVIVFNYITYICLLIWYFPIHAGSVEVQFSFGCLHFN